MSGWQGRGTAFQEVRPGAGFKTGDFVEEKFGGVTVERLRSHKLLPKKKGFKNMLHRFFFLLARSG